MPIRLAAFCAALGLGLVCGVAARAHDARPPRLYAVMTETSMPHLEENLRYTITHETRCLTPEELFSAFLSSAFPVLREPMLKGCRLAEEARRQDSVTLRLVCEGAHGTSGGALWELAEHLVRGTLNVKLGGKNMTFYQRVTAEPLGACSAEGR